MAKSKHPGLVVNRDLPKTEVNSWQLGRAMWEADGGTSFGPWSALHVASALAREHGGDIQTGFFDPKSVEVFAANKVGAAYANSDRNPG